ncbi:TraX family protein [Enterobacter wuhouensis]|uniref:TraX family protein n=1 Tax=Enterobacter wuhouensis TaxID=2529381 RepID=UPI0035245EF9
MSLPVPYVLHRIHLAESFSPAALDMIKVLALVAMLVDHINTLLLTWPEPLMYALGRMAFPLFTLIWAMNVQRTPERLQRRANRLWMWATVTQPVFSLAFVGHQPWWALNILFVFAGATQLLALQYRFGAKGLTAGVLLLATLVWPLSPASYGLAGLTLACGMVAGLGGKLPAVRRAGMALCILSLVCLNGISHLISLPEDTLLLATLPTLIFPLAAISLSRRLFPMGDRRFMPRHFFYMAYAGHLIIIALIVHCPLMETWRYNSAAYQRVCTLTTTMVFMPVGHVRRQINLT